MTTARQDAWSQDEDLLLAEVVLRHIREGSTQLAAFEEVGLGLSRTSAACGFRWNSYVRKQYQSAIEIAKQQRKGKLVEQGIKEESKSETDEQETQVIEGKGESLSFAEIITYLNGMHGQIQDKEITEMKNNELANAVQHLQEDNTKLKNEMEIYKEKCRLIEEDYKALIGIMERARKMVVLEETDSEKQMRFQMDKNGNLERVNK